MSISHSFDGGVLTIHDVSMLSKVIDDVGSMKITSLAFYCHRQPLNLLLIQSLTRLRFLSIYDGQVESPHILYQLPILEGLTLSNISLKPKLEFSRIGDGKLKSLAVAPWGDMSSIENCSVLESLYVAGYRKGDNLLSIGICGDNVIQHCQLVRCETKNMEYFHAPRLKTLTINRCPNIIDLTGLERSAETTRELVIETRTSVTDYSPIKDFVELEVLLLAGKNEIDNLEFLSNLKKLKRLALQGTVKTGDLSPILDLQNLEYLATKIQGSRSHTEKELKKALSLS